MIRMYQAIFLIKTFQDEYHWSDDAPWVIPTSKSCQLYQEDEVVNSIFRHLFNTLAEVHVTVVEYVETFKMFTIVIH